MVEYKLFVFGVRFVFGVFDMKVVSYVVDWVDCL